MRIFLQLFTLPAGAAGPTVFDVFAWSVQTGKLLDVLQSHEGPVSCVEFNPVKVLHLLVLACL